MKKSDYKRKVAVKETFDTILIVCEGEQTEPNYFKSFPVPTAKVEVIGVGLNTVGLVKKAKELRGKPGKYDQVWCVFDRDSFPPGNFNTAITMATDNKMRVAYSNEAFELWYLLHFDYHDTGMSRTVYQEKLTDNLGYRYKKNDRNMYTNLLLKQDVAIRNAERLLSSYECHNPHADNPCTTVHLLVIELNKYLKN